MLAGPAGSIPLACVMGAPGSPSKVRKPASVKTSCCAGWCSQARKAAADSRFVSSTHSASRVIHGLSEIRVPSEGYTAANGTPGAGCWPRVAGSPVGLPRL